MYLGQNFIRQSRMDKVLCVKYSRTSRKQPPKVQRLSGRLREVFVTRIEPQEVSSEKRSRHLHFMEDHYFIAFNV